MLLSHSLGVVEILHFFTKVNDSQITADGDGHVTLSCYIPRALTYFLIFCVIFLTFFTWLFPVLFLNCPPHPPHLYLFRTIYSFQNSVASQRQSITVSINLLNDFFFLFCVFLCISFLPYYFFCCYSPYVPYFLFTISKKGE